MAAAAPVVEGLEDRRLFAAAVYSNPVSQMIRDNAVINSSVSVSGMPGSITDVNVTANIDHTYDADLDVFLIGPKGQRVELFTSVGGSGDNFRNVTLDDQAGSSIVTGAAPFSGTFRPEGSLAALNGSTPNGTWTLQVGDHASMDTGVLRSWSVSVTTASAPPAQQPVVMSTGFYSPVPFSVPGDTNWLAGAPGRQTYEDNKVHFASDLPTANGTAVYAVAKGTVLDRRSDGFGNEVIFVQHQSTGGPFVGVYAHVAGSVSPGATVEAGMKIGQVADYLADGRTSNDHLHFGVRPGTAIPPSDGVTYGWGRADLAWYQHNGTNGLVAPINYLLTYRPATASTNAAPVAPTGFGFTPTGAGRGTLSWNDNSTNESGFRLQWLNGSTWTTWYTTGQSVRSVGVSFAAGYSYQMRVVAFNQYGEQPSSQITVRA